MREGWCLYGEGSQSALTQQGLVEAEDDGDDEESLLEREIREG